MFVAISFWSSSSVSCDKGLPAVWSRRNPRLRLRGSHPWVRMGGTISHSGVVVSHDLRCGMSLRWNRRGANPVVEEPALTWVVGNEGAAGSCSDVGRRCWRQLCQLFSISLAVDGAGLEAMLSGGTMAAGDLLLLLLLWSLSFRKLRVVSITSSWSRRGYQVGGGIYATDTSPTLLIVHLWIEFAEHNGFPTARDWFYCPTNFTEHKGGLALNATLSVWRDHYGGGIYSADTSPTSLLVHLWIELFAEYNGFPTARDWCYCPTNCTEHKGGRALNATLSIWRDHRIVRGCHTSCCACIN
jgi:hypothetical protein